MRYQRSLDPADARMAYEVLREAFAMNNSHYNGGQAVAIGLLAGVATTEEWQALARRVTELCLATTRSSGSSFWSWCSLGEVYLARGMIEEARAAYVEAFRRWPNTPPRNVASATDGLRRTGQAAGLSEELLEGILKSATERDVERLEKRAIAADPPAAGAPAGESGHVDPQDPSPRSTEAVAAELSAPSGTNLSAPPSASELLEAMREFAESAHTLEPSDLHGVGKDMWEAFTKCWAAVTKRAFAMDPTKMRANASDAMGWLEGKKENQAWKSDSTPHYRLNELGKMICKYVPELAKDQELAGILGPERLKRAEQQSSEVFISKEDKRAQRQGKEGGSRPQS